MSQQKFGALTAALAKIPGVRNPAGLAEYVAKKKKQKSVSQPAVTPAVKNVPC